MSTRIVYASIALLVAAFARLAASTFAMPPYAGLDEIYHAARIHFVLNEQRNPTPAEPSVASSFHRSMEFSVQNPLPAFVHLNMVWSAVVGASDEPLDMRRDSPISSERSYVTHNYEAQQPSAYYSIASLISRLSSCRTVLCNLRLWRFISLVFALITVAASMAIGYQFHRVPGLCAGALIAFIPTWHTLMLRASNDAIACAALAVGFMLTLRNSRRLALPEGMAWGIAVATKLLTWPAVALLIFYLWRQRASQRRLLVVGCFVIGAVVITVADLVARTGMLIGLEAFAGPDIDGGVARSGIAYLEMVKITIASGIWMSGQHVNALTPIGMTLYAVPLAVVLSLTVLRSSREERIRSLVPVGIVLLVFAVGQVVHAGAHIRNARLQGAELPLGGKEGWYWFSLASFVVPAVLGMTRSSLGRRAALFASAWLLLWDAMITVGALWRDYAGLATAASPSRLFRWGPSPRFSSELFDRLTSVAVGPLESELLLLFALGSGAALLLIPALLCAKDPHRSH